MNAFPNPELARQWRERLDRFDIAGMTIADFCQTEGYSVASFYQWRKRLRQTTSDSAGFVAIDIPEHDLASNTPETVAIELPGGAVVRLDALAGPSVYRPLLAAVVAVTDNAEKETP